MSLNESQFEFVRCLSRISCPFNIFLKSINFTAALVYPIEDEQCLMDDIWLHNVKLMEVSSESYPQMALNLWVIKIYGVSDPIQLVSAILAFLGLVKIQVDRLCFIRNNEDFGMASWTYAKSFLDWIIPFSTAFIEHLMSLSADCIPSWILLIGPSLSHPILFWISSLVYQKKHTPKTKSSTRHFSVSGYTMVMIILFIGYTFFIVSKKNTIPQ